MNLFVLLELALNLVKNRFTGKISSSAEVALEYEKLAKAGLAAYEEEVGQPLDLNKLREQ